MSGLLASLPLHETPTTSGDRSRRAKALAVALTVLLVVVLLLSTAIGPTGFTPTAAIDALTAAVTGDHAGVRPREWLIVTDIRLPRTLAGMMVGGALAVAGAVLQGLFRNPLADPMLIGISPGASLGAVIVIVVLAGASLGPIPSLYMLPVAACLFALGTILLLYSIATRRGRTSIATMLLTGLALAALANAMVGLLVFLSTDQQLRDFTFWSLGGLAGSTWPKVAIMGVCMALLLPILPRLAAGLDALLLGEAEAAHLGFKVQRLKGLAVLAVAVAVGASTAVAGPIGFVGIVVPHLLRLVIGPRHAGLLPASLLLGGALMVAADIVARLIVAPAELPLGIVTAFIGAPFFLWLLLRQRGLLEL